MNSIGKKIKRLREIKGFKQEHMSDLLNISQQSYSNIENGKIDVHFSKIEQIAEAFDMSVESLVGFDEKYILNNYGEVSGSSNTIGINHFPEKVIQLYEDKIKLLEDKVLLLEMLAKK